MQIGAVGAKRFVRMSVGKYKRQKGRKQSKERPEVVRQAGGNG